MQKRSKLGKFFKILLWTIITLLILIAMFVLVVFIVHKVKVANEWNMMEEAGYAKHVSAGDYNLNAYIYGNENGEHTIVGISGLSTNDYAISLKQVTDKLAEKNKIVIIDRAGNGLSEDTTKPQTIEQIISDYRTVLQNAGIKAPYVLMPHSIGGVYASYWQNAYPDEIEAVMYLDPTQIGSIENSFDEEDWKSHFSNWVEAFGCHLGLQRVFFGGDSHFRIPEELIEYQNAYIMKSPASFAICSEMDFSIENIEKTFNALKPNDIPKLYIDAGNYTKEDFIEFLEYMNERLKLEGLEDEIIDMSEENINQMWANGEKQHKEFYEQNVKSYVDKLGNCTYVNISGDHFIFQHKPEEVLKTCNDFLDTLK